LTWATIVSSISPLLSPNWRIISWNKLNYARL
jgi:hypothetical protein